MQSHTIPIFNYTVVNKDVKTLDVYIDGDIVDAATQEVMQQWWGDSTSTSYKSFRNQITQTNPEILNVYVNSPGGHVGDAMAIHDLLNDLEQKNVVVNRIGRGIIASAGTYILMGNKSQMSENSFMMIHNVKMLVFGSIQDCENQVATGRKFNDKIVDFYVNVTGNSKSVIEEWMNAETWMTAEEAAQRGFVTQTTPSVQFKNQIKAEAFPYNNVSILNSYNSQIKNFDMQKTIKDTINEAFAPLLEALGLQNKKSEKPITDAFETFSSSIETAINNLKPGITEEKVAELINASKPDISNFITKSDIANFATVENVNKVKDDLILALSEKAGDETIEPQTPNNKKVKGNKYSGIAYEEVTVK